MTEQGRASKEGGTDTDSAEEAFLSLVLRQLSRRLGALKGSLAKRDINHDQVFNRNQNHITVITCDEMKILCHFLTIVGQKSPVQIIFMRCPSYNA